MSTDDLSNIGVPENENKNEKKEGQYQWTNSQNLKIKASKLWVSIEGPAKYYKISESRNKGKL